MPIEPAEGLIPNGKAFGIPYPDTRNPSLHTPVTTSAARITTRSPWHLMNKGINQDEQVFPVVQALFVESPNPRISSDA